MNGKEKPTEDKYTGQDMETGNQGNCVPSWYLEKGSEYPVRHGNTFEVYDSGEKVFEVVAKSIEEAQKSVDIVLWGFDPAMPVRRRADIYKMALEKPKDVRAQSRKLKELIAKVRANFEKAQNASTSSARQNALNAAQKYWEKAKEAFRKLDEAQGPDFEDLSDEVMSDAKIQLAGLGDILPDANHPIYQTMMDVGEFFDSQIDRFAPKNKKVSGWRKEDAIGEIILKALADKSKEGLQIRIVIWYDAFSQRLSKNVIGMGGLLSEERITKTELNTGFSPLYFNQDYFKPKEKPPERDLYRYARKPEEEVPLLHLDRVTLRDRHPAAQAYSLEWFQKVAWEEFEGRNRLAVTFRRYISSVELVDQLLLNDTVLGAMDIYFKMRDKINEITQAFDGPWQRCKITLKRLPIIGFVIKVVEGIGDAITNVIDTALDNIVKALGIPDIETMIRRALIPQIDDFMREEMSYEEIKEMLRELGFEEQVDVLKKLEIEDEDINPVYNMVESITLMNASDHQKMILVDYETSDRHGYIMGHNMLTNYWSAFPFVHRDPRNEMDYTPYHDFSLRVNGPLLVDLNHNFCQAWDDHREYGIHELVQKKPHYIPKPRGLLQEAKASTLEAPDCRTGLCGDRKQYAPTIIASKPGASNGQIVRTLKAAPRAREGHGPAPDFEKLLKKKPADRAAIFRRLRRVHGRVDRGNKKLWIELKLIWRECKANGWLFFPDNTRPVNINRLDAIIVQEAEQFYDEWSIYGQKAYDALEKELRDTYDWLEKNLPEEDKSEQAPQPEPQAPEPKPQGSEPAAAPKTGGEAVVREVKQAYMQAVRNARNYILIVNQYCQYARLAREIKAWRKKPAEEGLPSTLYIFMGTCKPEQDGQVFAAQQMANELGVGIQFEKAEDEIYAKPTVSSQAPNSGQTPDRTEGRGDSGREDGGRGDGSMDEGATPKEEPRQTTQDGRMRQAGSHVPPSSLKSLKIKVLFFMFYTQIPEKGRERVDKTAQQPYIHAKLMVEDDAFFTLGSSNLNIRSMAVDSELNLISDDINIAQGFRHNLMGTYFGYPTAIEGEEKTEAEIERQNKVFPNKKYSDAKERSASVQEDLELMFYETELIAEKNTDKISKEKRIQGYVATFKDDRTALGMRVA